MRPRKPPPAALAPLRAAVRDAGLRFGQAVIDHPLNRKPLHRPTEDRITSLWRSILILAFERLAALRRPFTAGADPSHSSRAPAGERLGPFVVPEAGRQRFLHELALLEQSLRRPYAACGRSTWPVEALGWIYEGLAGWTAAVAPEPAGRLHLHPRFGRKRQGSFYTPGDLADPLAATTLAALPRGPAAGDCGRLADPGVLLTRRILDPAMGTGSLLRAAREVLSQSLLQACQELARAAHAPGLASDRLDPADLARRVRSLPWHGEEIWHRLVDRGPGERGDAVNRCDDQARLARLCNTLISAHCLFGIDLDPVAARIARIQLLSGTTGGRRLQDILAERLRTADALTDPQLDAIAAGPAQTGFDAVLCNPPWEKSLPLSREFFAAYHPGIRTAPTARERNAIQSELLQNPSLADAWHGLRSSWREHTIALAARYQWQSARIGDGAGGRKSKGHADLYRFFVERTHQVLRPDGVAGLILPHSFYANEGATGVRRLLLDQNRILGLEGFRNHKRLFEASPGLRFALLFFRKGGRTDRFPVRFGLGDARDLQHPAADRAPLPYRRALLARVAPAHLTFPECHSPREVALLEALYQRARPFRSHVAPLGIRLCQEMNMTQHSVRLTPTDRVLAGMDAGPDPAPGERPPDVRREPLRSRLARQGYLILHEKGTFRAYDDRVQHCPRYLCAARNLLDRPRVLDAAGHYRLAARATIHAGEPEKSAFCLLPPGVVVGNSALAEAAPHTRPAARALTLLAVVNSRAFGFAARVRLGTNLNQFILGDLPIPPLEGWERFLAHGALRLTCNHAAYADLWRDQIGESWREAGPRRRWPAVAPEPGRRLWACLDAAVAYGYGLAREQYGDLLRSLAPGATRWSPDEWMQAFDELVSLGPARYRQRVDPYDDLALRDRPAADAHASRLGSNSCESSTKGS